MKTNKNPIQRFIGAAGRTISCIGEAIYLCKQDRTW